jgi:hypothetical protein
MRRLPETSFDVDECFLGVAHVTAQGRTGNGEFCLNDATERLPPKR